MKKLPVGLTNSAQAAIFFIASLVTSGAAGAAMTEPYASYTVKAGDTVPALSRSLLNDASKWGELTRLNAMPSATSVQAGQVIDIPKSLLNLNSQQRVAVPGRLVSTVGDVKVGGQTVQAGVTIPEGSRIETGANGSAIVELGDGSRMQLMPKTLAEVTTQHGYALRDPSSSASTTWFSGAIRLVSGVLDTLANKQASRATPLSIITPTSVVGVRGTHFRVAYEDPASGSARSEVLEGAVQTDNPKQNASVRLGTGYGAAVKPDEREIKAVALLAAMPNTALPKEVLRIVGAHSEPDYAAWTVGTVPGAQGYHAQFAADDKFTAIVGDFKTASNAVDVKSLANGNYFARVRGIDPAGIEGYDAVQLVEIKSAAPQSAALWTRDVAKGASAEYIRNGVLLRINAKSADTPANVIVQIARDAAFTQGLQSVTLNPAVDASAYLLNVPSGQRSYVRFAGVTAQGLAASSPVYTLDVPRYWGSSVVNFAQALQSFR
jgi:hypothetical protein